MLTSVGFAGLSSEKTQKVGLMLMKTAGFAKTMQAHEQDAAELRQRSG